VTTVFLPFTVGLFIVLTRPVCLTAHTHCEEASITDKRLLSDKLRTLHITNTDRHVYIELVSM